MGYVGAWLYSKHSHQFYSNSKVRLAELEAMGEHKLVVQQRPEDYQVQKGWGIRQMSQILLVLSWRFSFHSQKAYRHQLKITWKVQRQDGKVHTS